MPAPPDAYHVRRYPASVVAGARQEKLPVSGFLICPQGHRYEIPSDAVTTPGVTPRCPFCEAGVSTAPSLPPTPLPTPPPTSPGRTTLPFTGREHPPEEGLPLVPGYEILE